MNHVFRRPLIAVAALLLLGFVSLAKADVWDLAADWSGSNNPNGVWSYGILNSSLSSFTDFTQQTNRYLGIGPGWQGPGPTGMAQNTGSAAALFDIPIGDVAGHTPTSSDYLAARWTAPDTGSFDLSGSVWRPNSNNPGRIEMVSLFVNNMPLFQDIHIPDQSATWNSAHPFTFEDAIAAGGGSASSLLDVGLQAGDTVTRRHADTRPKTSSA